MLNAKSKSWVLSLKLERQICGQFFQKKNISRIDFMKKKL